MDKFVFMPLTKFIFISNPELEGIFEFPVEYSEQLLGAREERVRMDY